MVKESGSAGQCSTAFLGGSCTVEAAKKCCVGCTRGSASNKDIVLV